MYELIITIVWNLEYLVLAISAVFSWFFDACDRVSKICMAESYHYGSYFGWANCYWNYIPYNLIFQLSINL